MYLVNVYYNADSKNSYLAQVWDIDNDLEKLVIALNNEEDLYDDNLKIIVKDRLRDHFTFREGAKIVINPSCSSIDGKSFEEFIVDAKDGMIFVPIGYKSDSDKTH
jgi:hypothetical protein